VVLVVVVVLGVVEHDAFAVLASSVR